MLNSKYDDSGQKVVYSTTELIYTPQNSSEINDIKSCLKRSKHRQSNHECLELHAYNQHLDFNLYSTFNLFNKTGTSIAIKTDNFFY